MMLERPRQSQFADKNALNEFIRQQQEHEENDNAYMQTIPSYKGNRSYVQPNAMSFGPAMDVGDLEEWRRTHPNNDRNGYPAPDGLRTMNYLRNYLE